MNRQQSYPISVKGVVVRARKVLLPKNERDGAGTPDPVLSFEHQQIREFAESEVPELVMPAGYKDSIASWYAVLRGNR